jgi:hypothetical protein
MELMRLHEGLNLDIPRLRDRYSSANLRASFKQARTVILRVFSIQVAWR